MKPMLAAATDGLELQYPLLASPKLDGIRCIIVDGVAMSRSLKPIPNKYVQSLLGRKFLNGLDGELTIGVPTAKDVFQKTTSGIMSIEGQPDFKFRVFDDIGAAKLAFHYRLEIVADRVRACPDFCKLVPHVIVYNEEDLFQLETKFLAKGYEGVMLRDPDGAYKFGRSTAKERGLVKLKRFVDSEAKVIGFTEQMHNSNKAQVNELGNKERSSKKSGMVKTGKLGSLIVQDLKSKIEFEIGTGFTDEQRVKLYNMDTTGLIVKYKYQPVGVKDKPRFPVFLGFRSQFDM